MSVVASNFSNAILLIIVDTLRGRGIDLLHPVVSIPICLRCIIITCIIVEFKLKGQLLSQLDGQVSLMGTGIKGVDPEIEFSRSAAAKSCPHFPWSTAIRDILAIFVYCTDPDTGDPADCRLIDGIVLARFRFQAYRELIVGILIHLTYQVKGCILRIWFHHGVISVDLVLCQGNHTVMALGKVIRYGPVNTPPGIGDILVIRNIADGHFCSDLPNIRRIFIVNSPHFVKDFFHRLNGFSSVF